MVFIRTGSRNQQGISVNLGRIFFHLYNFIWDFSQLCGICTRLSPVVSVLGPYDSILIQDIILKEKRRVMQIN